MTRLLALLLLSVSACDRGKSADELAAAQAELARDADPAVTAALEDPIMTDRDLAVADNSRRIRSVRGPAEASYPPRTAENAAIYGALKGLEPGPGCEAGFVAGARFAALPPPFALPESATLLEAAGNDRRGCAARMAAFRTTMSPADVATDYGARAAAAGYAAKPGKRGADYIAAGMRASDGASYFLIASPRGGGSEVSLLVTKG